MQDFSEGFKGVSWEFQSGFKRGLKAFLVVLRGFGEISGVSPLFRGNSRDHQKNLKDFLGGSEGK